MADPFDVTRLPSADLPRSVSPPMPRLGEKFLRGPIPWAWIEAASRLPGKALHAGLMIWREAGCTNRRTVSINLARLTSLGMSEKTARRAIQSLELAGLVTVDRPPGCGLRVTLVYPLDGHQPGSC